MGLRLGVIGIGAIGKEHTLRIEKKLSRAKVVAVNDVNREHTEAFLAQHNLSAKFYESGIELIRAQDVDAILVTSWGPTHEEFVLAAIAAGKYVFCEKPLAVTASGCRAIVEAEMMHGKQLVQVGFMRRFDKSYRQLKSVLDSEQLGYPLILNCAHRAPAAPGFAGDMAISDSLVHEFDVLKWLLNDDYVSAQVILPRKTRLCDDDLQDPHVVLLRTKQGILINIESFVNAQYGYDIQCNVVCESGTAALPEPSDVIVRHDAKVTRNIIVDWQLRFIEAFDVELQEWIDATSAGRVDGPSAWDGFIVAVTADACVAAKHSGNIEPINIPERPVFYR